MGRGEAQEALPLTKELLAVDDYWMRKSVLFRDAGHERILMRGRCPKPVKK